jgi:ECF sigma factor
MRHILVEHAKSQGRLKRGCRPKRVTLKEQVAVEAEDALYLLDLHEALERLAQHDLQGPDHRTPLFRRVDLR